MGKRRNFNDMVGRSFGRLTVSFVSIDARGRSVLVCLCSCGKTTQSAPKDLRSGRKKSCGCLKNDLSAERCRTHGGTGTKEYRIWNGMKARCLNPTDTAYKYYGGRGITISEEWNDFTVFLSDMGPIPSARHTLERINNDIGYGKHNCRWATMKEQLRNRSNNHKLTLNGETHCITEWSEILGIKVQTIHQRIRSGHNIENILSKTNSLYRKRIRNNHILELNGEKLCIAEWSDRVGISRETICRRIKDGWSVHDSLSILPKNTKKNNGR